MSGAFFHFSHLLPCFQVDLIIPCHFLYFSRSTLRFFKSTGCSSRLLSAKIFEWETMSGGSGWFFLKSKVFRGQKSWRSNFFEVHFLLVQKSFSAKPSCRDHFLQDVDFPPSLPLYHVSSSLSTFLLLLSTAYAAANAYLYLPILKLTNFYNSALLLLIHRR